MAEPTIQALDNSVKSLRKTLTGFISRLEVVEEKFDVYITSSELQSQINTLESTISDLNTAVYNIEQQLNKVILPEDTRFYLAESEITDFRNHFRQLRAFMTSLERSRQAFIRLSSRYNLTNSSI